MKAYLRGGDSDGKIVELTELIPTIRMMKKYEPKAVTALEAGEAPTIRMDDTEDYELVIYDEDKAEYLLKGDTMSFEEQIRLRGIKVVRGAIGKRISILKDVRMIILLIDTEHNVAKTYGYKADTTLFIIGKNHNHVRFLLHDTMQLLTEQKILFKVSFSEGKIIILDNLSVDFKAIKKDILNTLNLSEKQVLEFQTSMRNGAVVAVMHEPNGTLKPITHDEFYKENPATMFQRNMVRHLNEQKENVLRRNIAIILGDDFANDELARRGMCVVQGDGTERYFIDDTVIVEFYPPDYKSGCNSILGERLYREIYKKDKKDKIIYEFRKFI